MTRRSREINTDPARLRARIAAAERRAARALRWERVWPRLAPLVGVVLAFLTVSFLGLWRAVDGFGQAAILAGFAAALLASAWALRGIARPTPGEARARVERASSLDHTPLQALDDELARGDGAPTAPAAKVLWSAHQGRLAARIGRLRAGRAEPRLDRHDRYGLRGALLILFGLGLVAARGEWGDRIGEAFAFAPPAEVAPVRIDAWISPPTYTRRAPLVITEIGLAERGEGVEVARDVRVPTGSVVTVRSVQPITAALETPAGALPLEASATPGSATLTGLEGVIARAGRLVVRLDGEEVRAWEIDVVPDEAPSIAFLDPGLAGAERGAGLRITYETGDDYGVTEAAAVVAPATPRGTFPWAAPGGEDAPAPRPLYEIDPVRLALPRGGREGTGQTVRDFSEHPFATTPVGVMLEARDAAGQVARSGMRETVLPGTAPRLPLAKAVMEQARVLARDANAARRVERAIETLTLDPEEDWPDMRAYLGLRSAYWRLRNAANDDELRDTVELLMAVARGIDEGGLSTAQRDLLAAQEALRDALERGAPEEELAALMDELREAMRRAMQEMMANAGPMPPGQQSQTPPTNLDDFLDQLERALGQDDRSEAEQLLSQLERMMEQMMSGQMQAQPQGSLPQQFSEALDELSEMMRRQQELMDETFERQQQQSQPGQQGRQPGQEQQGRQPGQRPQPGQGEPMTPEEFAEAMEQLRRQQQALEEALGELAERMEGLGLEPGELGEAGEAMGRAGRQLGQGEPGEAVGPQGQALDAMRRAGRGMAQQMQEMMRQLGQGQPGQPGQGRQLSRGEPQGDTDPLGRPRGENGQRFDSDVAVPDALDAQRARDILEELRRRLGEIGRPRDELDYLERLLERF